MPCAPPAVLVVVPFRDDLAQHFAALNREWIERYFVLEEADVTVFEDPRGTIVGLSQYRNAVASGRA